jgi:catechol 2,3-dioxygenase-like lactoylglutathione lyase family enzyme
MADHATPNLPARDFDASERFYAALGFETSYRADGWMIMERGGLCIEFFGYPDLDPAQSAFSCCFRLDDLDGFCGVVTAAGIPDQRTGWPRLHPAVQEDWGGRVAYLVDLDGTLIRLVENG